MSWFFNFLSSSIGRKLLMSLTGLFLILFLTVHLLGNLQLLKEDGGQAFNEYAYIMTHNPLIIIISFGNYFFILLHAFLGLFIWLKNRGAKGSSYAVGNTRDTTWASKNMALLGTLILAFIFIHMGDFWWKMKFGNMGEVNIEGHLVKDLYTRVAYSFKELWIVIVYIIGLIVLAFHLSHGFASAFQTLGLNHSKYNGIIKNLGLAYAVLVPLGFAVIPVVFYLYR
jgi:succinate dehydrogenase / fumarate reductase, cytochrome b subunit